MSCVLRQKGYTAGTHMQSMHGQQGFNCSGRKVVTQRQKKQPKREGEWRKKVYSTGAFLSRMRERESSEGGGGGRYAMMQKQLYTIEMSLT